MASFQNSLLDPAIESKVNNLLEKMSLLEKAGQLNQLGANMVGGFDFEAFMDNPDPELLKNVKRDFHEDWIKEGAVGSFLGIQGADEINKLQKIAVEESRLGIPLIFGLDVIHGYSTIFPIPLAESCSWEPELARKSSEAAAREASAAGIHWTFAPMMDIARDARWGRIAEGSGEDAYLGSLFAAARVKGFQGDDLKDPSHLAAFAKHYIGYGAATAGRDYNTVEMAMQTLHEVYLPPFKAAIDAGVLTVMSAFNDLNGVPTTANRLTLTEILRNQLGFSGFVISDSNAVGELVAHGFAEDRKDAGHKAIRAGVDMDMVTESFRFDIPDLVESGQLPIEIVDEAVRRVLRVKFLLGLFENPYRSNRINVTASQLNSETISLAREAGKRSIVLLKNEKNALPINKNVKTIAVIGELSDNRSDMLGSWSFTGSPENVVTILEGIKAATDARVIYSPGYDRKGFEPILLTEAIKTAEQADVVIVTVGETARMSGEAASRLDLGLPQEQEKLVTALSETGKPLILLLSNGRPLTISKIVGHADAVLETWQLGTQAGNSIADVLFGSYNPSGKLTASFPHSVGQLPLYYNHPNTGRPAGDFFFTSKYIDGPVEPFYPFGYGLSYTTFEYSELVITVENKTVNVSGMLTNTGNYDGEEVVQLYIRDVTASRVRPVKELKGFQKIFLPKGSSTKVNFTIEFNNLGFYNENMEFIVEPGLFKVWISPDSSKGIEGVFIIKEN